MSWVPEKQQRGGARTAPTQIDQMKLDEHTALEVVARESIQNALDARSDAGAAPARVSFRLVEDGGAGKFLQDQLNGIRPHGDAAGFYWDDANAPFAFVIEDKGTSGLVGSADGFGSEEEPFTSFWFEVASSQKGGKKQGRNGVGRLSFAGASRMSCFFGVTVRASGESPLLMGMAVLGPHKIEGERYEPVIYFGERRAPDRDPRPVQDLSVVKQFCAELGIERSEPGLSVVIPFPAIEPEGWSGRLIDQVIRNHFFSILTGALVVDVGEASIDTRSIWEHSRGSEIEPFLAFLKEALELRDSGPLYPIDPSWQKAKRGITDEHLPEGSIDAAAAALGRNEVVGFTAPLTVRSRQGLPPKVGELQVFLRLPKEGEEEGRDLFVRDDLAISDEHWLRGRRVLGLVIASESSVATLLGDAESAAHTRWVLGTTRLANRYTNGPEVVTRTRYVLPWLHDAILGHQETEDRRALQPFFQMPAGYASSNTNEPRKPKDIDPPTPRKTEVAVEPSYADKAGFKVFHRPGPGNAAETRTIVVKAEYRAVEGKGKRLHNDFDFADPRLCPQIAVTNGSVEAQARSATELELVGTGPFSVTVSGFDSHRDLHVEWQLETHDSTAMG